MRITTQMIGNRYVSDARNNLNVLQTITQQMTSGKSISKPSDNPFKVARSMQMNTDIDSNKQYNTNIKSTINWLDTTDESLNQVNSTITRIRTLMVSAGDAAYGSDERNDICDEINERISELGQILNGNFDGKYLFGGTKTMSTPLNVGKDANGNSTLYYADANGNAMVDTDGKAITKSELTYNDDGSLGSYKLYYTDGTEVPTAEIPTDGEKYAVALSNIDGEVYSEISQGVTIQYNITASDVINYGTNADGTQGNLISLLNTIVSNLNSPKESATEEITGKNLDDISKVLDNVSSLRAEVGAKQNRMESAKSKNEDDNYNMTDILSSTEDIDLTEKSIEYATAQTVYQATLQVSAQILPKSLLDYL